MKKSDCSPEQWEAYKASMRAFYKRNREKVLAKQKASDAAKLASLSPEQLAEERRLRAQRSKASRQRKIDEYRERERASQARYLASLTEDGRHALWRKNYRAKRKRMDANPEYAAAQRAEAKGRHNTWREANRDHVNASSRAWAAANPEYRKTIAIVMAHKRRAAGPIDFAFVAWIKQQACIDCGSQEKIEVGHIVPIKLGGTNDPANLIPQCRSCNRRLSSHPHKAVSLE